MARLFAGAHLRRPVRLGGGRWMSRLDVGDLLGPAGLYLRGRRLCVGQRTARFLVQSPKRPRRDIPKIIQSEHGGCRSRPILWPVVNRQGRGWQRNASMRNTLSDIQSSQPATSDHWLDPGNTVVVATTDLFSCVAAGQQMPTPTT